MKVLFISENMGLRSSMARALPNIQSCKHGDERKLIEKGGFTHIIVSEADQDVGKKTFEGLRRKLWISRMEKIKVLRMGVASIEAGDYTRQPFRLSELLDRLREEKE